MCVCVCARISSPHKIQIIIFQTIYCWGFRAVAIHLKSYGKKWKLMQFGMQKCANWIRPQFIGCLQSSIWELMSPSMLWKSIILVEHILGLFVYVQIVETSLNGFISGAIQAYAHPRWCHSWPVLNKISSLSFPDNESKGKCFSETENLYLGERLSHQQTIDIVERPSSSKPRRKEVEVADHIQFLITQKSEPKTSSTDDQNQVDESDVEVTGGGFVIWVFRLMELYFRIE